MNPNQQRHRGASSGSLDAFEQKVLKSIRGRRLLEGEDRIIVALSGGPDSVALLLALLRLAPLLEVDVSAAHFNHRLRGEESDQDETFVRALCRNLNVPLDVAAADTAAIAAGWKRNLEESARRLRYRFLLKLAAASGAAVATGHTLDDQAETFLLKLFRGAGLTGLSGIFPVKLNRVGGRQGRLEVRVFRPLLERSETEIRDYLARRRQKFRRDSSNLDLRFERNWLRSELIPLLQSRLNPRLAETLDRTSRLLREARDFQVAAARKALRECAVRRDSDLVVDVKRLLEHPAALKREILRQCLFKFRRSLKGITMEHTDSLLKLARGASGRQLHLPGGVRVIREFQRLRFTREATPGPFSYELNVPGTTYVRELNKEVRSLPLTGPSVPPQVAAVIETGTRHLIVRNRRPGDRYRPAGQEKVRRLKKILQEKRIPVSRRDQLLVVQIPQGEILWVEGLQAPPSGPPRGEAVSRVALLVRSVSCEERGEAREAEEQNGG